MRERKDTEKRGMGSGVGDGGREREGRWKESERQNGRPGPEAPASADDRVFLWLHYRS